MERIADKAVALALSAVAALTPPAPVGAATVVGVLAATLISAVIELKRAPWLAAAGAAAIAVWPGALAWLTLLVYDLAGLGWAGRAVAVAALVGCLGRVPAQVAAQTVVFSGIVGLLAWRTGRSEATLGRYRNLRDRLTAALRRLRELTAGLAERQDLELRLATADERSRIAREIHDNAGHLLTRALLQTKALAVARPGLGEDLDGLGATLDEAMESLRASVHALRDEGLDLEARLAALGAGTRLEVTVDYQAGEVPPPLGRAVIAIAREAVSNSLRHSDAGAVAIAV
ncbi:MAG: histidine kinase, partial [Bifidobacteriaceae bacterium]|nr:histidine kinase [Bifidobacteriaceae bacterium]